ncbi:MAG: hypothetical protein C4278_02370 [Patescibacteria group bacterium]
MKKYYLITNIFKEIINALKLAFNSKVYLIAFIFLFLLFSYFVIWINFYSSKPPIYFILFFKSISLKEKFLILLLSALISLNLIFNFYLLKNNKKESIKNAPLTIFGSIFGLLGGIISSAFCLSCLAVPFSFLGLGLGFGSMLFVFKYRFYIVLIAIILLSFSLYFLSRKINKTCQCFVST